MISLSLYSVKMLQDDIVAAKKRIEMLISSAAKKEQNSNMSAETVLRWALEQEEQLLALEQELARRN